MPNTVLQTGPLYGGISQQTASARHANQVGDSTNFMFTVQNGAEKRPGTEMIHEITGLVDSTNYRIHVIDRDNTEQYAVVYGPSVLRVFDLVNRVELPTRVDADAQTYLDYGTPTADDYIMTTVADYTIIANGLVGMDGKASDDFVITKSHYDYDTMIATNPTYQTYHHTENDTATRTAGTYQYILEENGFAYHDFNAVGTSWNEVSEYDGVGANPMGFKVTFTDPDGNTHVYNVVDNFFDEPPTSFDDIAKRFTKKLQDAGASDAFVRWTNTGAPGGYFSIMSPYRGVGAAVTSVGTPDNANDITNAAGEPFYGGTAYAGSGSPDSATYPVRSRWQRVAFSANDPDAAPDETTMPIKMVRVPISTDYGKTYQSAVEAKAYAYYRLGEAVGETVANDDMGSYSGTYVGTPTLAETGALTNDTDTAVTFASAKYVSATTLGTFGSSIGSGIAVSAWVKTTTTNIACVCGVSESSAQMSLQLVLNRNESYANEAGLVHFYFRDFAANIVDAATDDISINDGSWHFIVANLRPSLNSIEIWVDGVKQDITYGSQDSPNNFTDFTDPLYIGALDTEGGVPTYSLPFVGTLDEVALYQTPLTESEILVQYNRGMDNDWAKSNTYFHLSTIDWDVRETGDVDTNPIMKPLVDNRPVEDMTFHRNRFVIASDEHVMFSETDESFNFYFADPTNIGDADPIDVLTSGGDPSRISVCDFLVSFRNIMVVFTKSGQQYEFNDPDAFNHSTVSVTPSTAYQSMEGVRPTVVGSQVYFVAKSTESTWLYEYYYDDASVSNIAANVTAHTNTLLPTQIKTLVSAANSNTVFVIPVDSQILYAYRMFWNGAEKLQSAWTKYDFDSVSRVVDSGVIDEELYLLIEDSDEYRIHKVQSSQDRVASNAQFVIHADGQQDCGRGNYDSTADQTIWVLDVNDTTLDTAVYTDNRLEISGVAADFGSSAGRLQTSTINADRVPLTWTCWAKGNGTIFSLNETGTPDELYSVGAAGFSLIYGNGYTEAAGGWSENWVDKTRWHHFAVVVDYDYTWRVHIDGHLFRSGTFKRWVIDGIANQFSVGSDPDGDANDFNGQIAHVALFDVALTKAQVRDLAKGVSPATGLTGVTPTVYWDDFSGAGPHSPSVGTGDLTEVGTVGDGEQVSITQAAGPASGDVYTISVSGGKAVMSGDLSGYNAVICRKFTSSLVLSRPYVRSEQGQSLQDVEVQISKTVVHFKEAAEFDFKIEQGNRAARTLSYSAPTGTLVSGEGNKQFLTISNTKDTTLTITDDSVFPLTIAGVEYIATTTQRSG